MLTSFVFFSLLLEVYSQNSAEKIGRFPENLELQPAIWWDSTGSSVTSGRFSPFVAPNPLQAAFQACVTFTLKLLGSFDDCYGFCHSSRAVFYTWWELIHIGFLNTQWIEVFYTRLSTDLHWYQSTLNRRRRKMAWHENAVDLITIEGPPLWAGSPPPLPR